jgi:hypothetical protein
MARIHIYIEGFAAETAFADITDEQLQRLSPQEISERFCVPAIAYLMQRAGVLEKQRVD